MIFAAMTSESRARLAIGGVVLIWGANFAVIKTALVDLHPLAFNALRFPLASLTLWAFWRRSGRRLPFGRGDAWTLIGLGILGHVAYQPLFIFGLDRTLAGNSSLLLATVPVWVALLSVVLGHERLPVRTWVGIGVSLVGIGLVVRGGSAAVGFGHSTLAGDLLTLAAAIVWAAYTVLSTPMVRRHGALPVTAVTLWIGTAGLVALGIPWLAGTSWDTVRPGSWAGVGYAGALGLGVAYLLWYTSVRHVGSSRTAIGSNLVPVVALLVAWPALGERPTGLQLAGAAAILGGVTLARRIPADRRVEAAPPEEV